MASARVPRLWPGDTRPVARRSAPGHLRSAGPSHGDVVYRRLSRVPTHHPADEGRGVRWTHACGHDRALRAGRPSPINRPRRGSPGVRARAQGGTPRRAPRASRRQGSVVRGRRDHVGDRMCRAAVTRWACGARVTRRAVCRPRGHGSLQRLPLVPCAVAPTVLGASAPGLRSEARPWWGVNGTRGSPVGTGVAEVDVVASGAHGDLPTLHVSH